MAYCTVEYRYRGYVCLGIVVYRNRVHVALAQLYTHTEGGEGEREKEKEREIEMFCAALYNCNHVISGVTTHVSICSLSLWLPDGIASPVTTTKRRPARHIQLFITVCLLSPGLYTVNRKLNRGLKVSHEGC